MTRILYILIGGLLGAIRIIHYDPFDRLSYVPKASLTFLPKEQLHYHKIITDHHEAIHDGVLGGMIIDGEGPWYRNEEFGFEIMVPEIWGPYKVFVYKNYEYTMIDIVIQTMEERPIINPYRFRGYQSRKGYNMYDQDDYIHDYYPMLSFDIWPKDSYHQEHQECLEVGGPCEKFFTKPLGETEQYYIVSGWQEDVPVDLLSFYEDRETYKKVMNSFRML